MEFGEMSSNDEMDEYDGDNTTMASQSKSGNVAAIEKSSNLSKASKIKIEDVSIEKAI